MCRFFSTLEAHLPGHRRPLLPPVRLSRRHDRRILALAIPALGALAADPLVSLVDTAFVGRLGSVPLAALGINVSVFSFAFIIFNFLAYGTTPMVGKAVGRGDRAEAGRVALRAIVLALIVGTAALILLQALASPILQVMGATGELLAPSLTYLRIRAFAGPAVLLVMAGHGIFRGVQDTRTPLLVTIGLNVVNLILDPILIFGLGWGLAGAAAATVIAQWTGAIWFLWLILHRRRDQLGIASYAVPTLGSLLPLARVGWDLSVRSIALVGTMTLATAVAARVGVVEVAAHQIAAQLWLFLALVVDALAIAAQALVSKYLGSGSISTARAVANRTLLWGLGTGIVLLVSFAALAPFLPYAFTSEAAVIAAVLSVFPFVAALQPLNALVFVGDGIFMGAEAFPYLARTMLISAAGACLVLLLVIPLSLGLVGVWWGITTLMALRGLTLAWGYWGPRPILS